VRPSPALPGCGSAKRPPFRTQAHHCALDGSRCFQQHPLPDEDKAVGRSSFADRCSSFMHGSFSSSTSRWSSSVHRSLLLFHRSLLLLHASIAAPPLRTGRCSTSARQSSSSLPLRRFHPHCRSSSAADPPHLHSSLPLPPHTHTSTTNSDAREEREYVNIRFPPSRHGLCAPCACWMYYSNPVALILGMRRR
jgi:hypothetical protein